MKGAEIRVRGHEKPLEPDELRMLGAAVLLRALRDAVSHHQDMHLQIARGDAQRWLTTPSRDLSIICSWVDLEPLVVIRKSADLIAAGLRFNGKGHNGAGFSVGDIIPEFSACAGRKGRGHEHHHESAALAGAVYAAGGIQSDGGSHARH